MKSEELTCYNCHIRFYAFSHDTYVSNYTNNQIAYAICPNCGCVIPKWSF